MLLIILTNFGKDKTGKLRKTHAKMHLESIFIPENYVFRVCFESPFRLLKVDSQFPVTLLCLVTNADQIFHYFE